MLYSLRCSQLKAAYRYGTVASERKLCCYSRKTIRIELRSSDILFACLFGLVYIYCGVIIRNSVPILSRYTVLHLSLLLLHILYHNSSCPFTSSSYRAVKMQLANPHTSGRYSLKLHFYLLTIFGVITFQSKRESCFIEVLLSAALRNSQNTLSLFDFLENFHQSGTSRQPSFFFSSARDAKILFLRDMFPN